MWVGVVVLRRQERLLEGAGIYLARASRCGSAVLETDRAIPLSATTGYRGVGHRSPPAHEAEPRETPHSW